jgi:hypothetical protein
LLTEGEVFENEILSRTESTDNPAQKMPEGNSHGENLIGTSQIELVVKLLILRVFDLLANDRAKVPRRTTSVGDVCPSHKSLLLTFLLILSFHYAFQRIKQRVKLLFILSEKLFLALADGTGSCVAKRFSCNARGTPMSSQQRADLVERILEKFEPYFEGGVFPTLTSEEKEELKVILIGEWESIEVSDWETEMENKEG